MAANLALLPIPKKVVELKDGKENYDEIVNEAKLSLKLHEELQKEKLPHKLEQIKQRINHCEEKINCVVYKLYNLTETEIKIVEQSVNE